MRESTKNKGFTLIEILLVVVIMGIMLAVIVPRAWRANIDSKYGLVRQAATELSSFGMNWAEQMSQAQVDTDAATIKNYLDTLSGRAVAVNWVARNLGSNNWKVAGTVTGRSVPVEATVEAIVPPEKVPRNPFSGASVFANANDPVGQNHIVAGAIACAKRAETADPNSYVYYAFLYQGTDSIATNFVLNGCFHAGQTVQPGTGPTVEGLRNGVFFARTR